MYRHHRIVATVIGFAAFLIPGSAFAATLFVVPDATTVTVGGVVGVTIYVNSSGTAINASDGTLAYPPVLLPVSSLSTSGSIFGLWAQQPAFNNAGGVLTWNGGTVTPYAGSAGKVLRAVFLAQQPGTATLSFSSANVYAADGLGTNVASGATGSATITITAASAPTPAPTQPAPVSGGSSIQLSSPTHPDPDAWYNDPNPLVLLGLPSGTQEDETIVSSSLSTAPSVLYQNPINQKQVTDLPDGVWYFIARAKVSGVWGPVSSFALHIDTKAPTISGLTLTYDTSHAGLVVHANVADPASGVDAANVTVDGDTAPVTLDALTSGYLFPYKTSGTHTLVFSVTDKAGNTASSSATFTVPEARGIQDWFNGTFAPVTDVIILIIVLCSIASLVFTTYLWTRIKKYIRHPDESIVDIAQETRKTLVLFGRDVQRRIRSIERARARENLSDEDAERLDLMREQLEKLEDEVVKRLKKLDLG